MITPEVQKLIQSVLEICTENGYIGFVGGFRTTEGYHCFSLSHPNFSDGECEIFQGQLETAINATGAELINRDKSVMPAPNPTSDEMPH